MIGLIDYGLGNINAFSNILKTLNVDFIIPNNKEQIKICNKFILPGVGAFDEAVLKIKKLEYFKEFEESILLEKKDILGVCVGMQVFLNTSEEGSIDGLGWVNGSVRKFLPNKRIPHMGWNKIVVENKHNILNNIENDEFYFLHSYYCEVKNSKKVCTYTNYFENFCSIFIDNNIYGIQFHPEKSHDSGKSLIKNFIFNK